MNAPSFHLAQVNIARPQAPMDSEFMTSFIPEAEKRLTHLRDHGPTPHSFTFKERFDAPARAAASA